MSKGSARAQQPTHPEICRTAISCARTHFCHARTEFSAREGCADLTLRRSQPRFQKGPAAAIPATVHRVFFLPKPRPFHAKSQIFDPAQHRARIGGCETMRSRRLGEWAKAWDVIHNRAFTISGARPREKR